jgi:hypothetical protein
MDADGAGGGGWDGSILKEGAVGMDTSCPIIKDTIVKDPVTSQR